MTPAASLVLAASLTENETLTKLDLAGNTPGRGGARALMKAMQDAQRGAPRPRSLDVSLVNCDVTRAVPTLFDPLEVRRDDEDRCVTRVWHIRRSPVRFATQSGTVTDDDDDARRPARGATCEEWHDAVHRKPPTPLLPTTRRTV